MQRLNVVKKQSKYFEYLFLCNTFVSWPSHFVAMELSKNIRILCHVLVTAITLLLKTEKYIYINLRALRKLYIL